MKHVLLIGRRRNNGSVFYSLISSVDEGRTRYSGGTFEANGEIVSNDEYVEAVDKLCEHNNVDRAKP